MKKVIFFVILIALWLFYVNIYEYNSIKGNLKPFFFLYLRIHPDYGSISLNDFIIPKYDIEDISDNNFYVKSVVYNPLVRKISLQNVIITDNVFKEIKNIIKNYDYINAGFKIIKFSNVRILLNNNILDFISGSIVHRKKFKDFLFDFKGCYKKIFFDVKGKVNNSQQLFYTLSFDKISFEDLFLTLLKLPNISIFNSNLHSIKGKLNFIGNIDNVSLIKFRGIIDNNSEISFRILKKLKSYYFEDGVINFLNLDNNNINFKGKILNQSNWTFVFYSKGDKLIIPIDNTTLKFDEVNLNYSLNSTDDERLNILKLSALNTVIDDNDYNFIKKFFEKTNYVYSIYIDNLFFDNLTVENLDINISDDNGQKSINKFNFDLDKGKVLYSYIVRDKKFQWAVNIRNIDIKKLIKFILNKDINISGRFKLNFLASGKDKNFILGNGLLSAKNVILEGVAPKQLDKTFQEGDILNLNIISNGEKNNDNYTVISKVSSKLSVDQSNILLNNFNIDCNLFKLILNGKINLNSPNNIILDGKYISPVNPSKEVLLNINLKDKFIQFIGK